MSLFDESESVPLSESWQEIANNCQYDDGDLYVLLLGKK